MISLTLPLRLVSEANAHTHWRQRQKRAKAQRGVVFLRLRGPLFLVALDGLLVTLTRIAPRSLDSDNLAGSAKAVRDGVADALGIDDGDPRITWRYGQERGKPKEYAVRIEIEEAGR